MDITRDVRQGNLAQGNGDVQSVSATSSRERRKSWLKREGGSRRVCLEIHQRRPELVAEMSLPIFVCDFNVPSLKTNMEPRVSSRS